jgi:hypothetical protein
MAFFTAASALRSILNGRFARSLCTALAGLSAVSLAAAVVARSRSSGMYGVDLFFVSFERALLLVYRFSLPDCLLSSS